LGCQVNFVDATDRVNVEAALRDNTRIVFVETIANPRTQVADLEGIGQLCSERGILYIVDNTLTSPYLFRPTEVDAGLVINSLTKYICGHGNALGGAVTDTGLFDWKRFPNIYSNYRGADEKLWGITQIRKKGLRDIGATLQAEAAHRIAAGAETLTLRMDRICSNAQKLAQYFESHPAIAKVYYPGLEQHPEHQRACRLFKGYGGILAIELNSGSDYLGFLRKLKIVICSSHLGDNRTLAIPVAETIYWEMGARRRRSMGISDSLIRISVGIEDIDDLIDDFKQALSS
jgi:O-acetylhomoserine (thiol)-lyase